MQKERQLEKFRRSHKMQKSSKVSFLKSTCFKNFLVKYFTLEIRSLQVIYKIVIPNFLPPHPWNKINQQIHGYACPFSDKGVVSLASRDISLL